MFGIMELYITEIDTTEMDTTEIYTTDYEQIPENMPIKNSVPKINVKKQNRVTFIDQEQEQKQNQNIKPYLSGPKAKITRPIMPPPKPQISYDDILNKMGMFVANGKLHLLDEHNLKPQQKPEAKAYIPNPQGSAPQQNSYIYNKYFQNSSYNQNIEEHRPLTPLEYRNKLINDIIQKQKIRQMKSTKLIMPNSNINFAQGPTGNLNKLFGFSQR
jgi:hypothetical protein